MKPLTAIHLYHLIMWKEVIPYVKFSDISATRQKVAMDLLAKELVVLEPFITVTDKGLYLLSSCTEHISTIVGPKKN